MSQIAAGPAARAVLSEPRARGGMDRDWVPVLAGVPLFRTLSRRHLKRVASVGRTRRFASGTAIVRAGDAGTAFYVLIDGAARVVTARGRPRRLGPGDFFGEMSLLDDSPRSADVVAEGEVLALTISPTAFGKLVRGEPGLAHELLKVLAARLRAAERSSVG